ncbi:MAG TPA: hypothetical protein ENO18_01155 [Caldithrix sp.]|nr:hypothetical protein [Caldithrix sp.]
MANFIKKYGQLFVGSVFLLYFLYTFSNALDIGIEVVISTFLTIILYFQSIGVFLYFYKKKGKPRLQDWFRLALFVTLVLDFMEIVNSAEGSVVVKFIVSSISLFDSPFAMLVIIFALLSLDIAYFIMNTFKKSKASNENYAIRRKNWIFAILVLSTMIKGYLLFSGLSGYGSSLEYTTGLASLAKTLANILNPFALIVSAYIIFIESSHNRKYHIVFYFILLLQVFLGLLSGMKEEALIPLLYTGIVFLIAGKKLPQKGVYMGIFILALLYPLNNAYRNVINDPYLNTGSSILNISIAVNKIVNEPLAETLSTGISQYGDRGSMFPFFQYSINIEPSWDYYKNMARYFALPVVWLVPRAMWEDKPKADIGGVLYEHIVGERTMTAVTPTTLGWAYLEGGFVFVIIIFLLLGLMLEFIDKNDYREPIVLIFYVILLHKAIKPEWDVYFMFATMLQMFILYWGLLKILGVNKGTYSEN